MQDIFGNYIKRWTLTPDGQPIQTHSSHLLPVRCADDTPAILKVALADEEKAGARLMEWWNGQGAAHVLGREGDTLLLERAVGLRSLERMVRDGHDDDATRILCGTVARLHTRRNQPLPELSPLSHWFGDLKPAAAKYGGILTRSAAMAEKLLSSPRDVVVLHGDIHHFNVLDFGERGWLAIDPKSFYGERTFDYANVFCNPNGETITAPGRVARQVSIISEEAQIEKARLLCWILAWAGLSSAWHLSYGGAAEETLTVAEIVAAELDR